MDKYKSQKTKEEIYQQREITDRDRKIEHGVTSVSGRKGVDTV